jgi:hypothetical protein
MKAKEGRTRACKKERTARSSYATFHRLSDKRHQSIINTMRRAVDTDLAMTYDVNMTSPPVL